MNLAIIVLIVLFSISSFFFARTKVKKIAISNQTKLNALPDYYGFYLSLWCALPALLILIVWTIFEPSIIKAFIFQGISGENAQTYNNSELNLIYQHKIENKKLKLLYNFQFYKDTILQKILIHF